MKRGFIKLWRKMQEWEWYADSDTKAVFLHLLLTANHKDSRWQGVDVKRGQVVTGRKKLSAELGISQQTIRTCLNRLKSTNEITNQSTNQFSIITVCNYESFQPAKDDTNQPINQPANQRPTSNQPATNQQSTTSKECKEGKNVKNGKKKSKAYAPDGADVFKPLDFLSSHGVEKLIAEDWLKVRKTKRLANTETAFKRIGLEIAKIPGLTWNETLRECCERGWAGFKKSWVDAEKAKNDLATGRGKSKMQTTAESLQNFMAEGDDHEQKNILTGNLELSGGFSSKQGGHAR